MRRVIPYLLATVLLVAAGLFVFSNLDSSGPSAAPEPSSPPLASTQAPVRGDFDRLTVAGPFKVTLRVSDAASYSLEGPEELLERVKAELVGGHLRLSFKSGVTWGSTGSVAVTITVPTLRELDLTGAVSAESEGTLVADRLAVDLSGGTSLTLDLSVKNLSLEGSGATDVTLTGVAESLDIDFSGGSKLRAKDLKAKRVTLESSGASDIELYADESLALDVSGASRVRYAGNPAQLETDSRGASSIQPLK